MTKVDIISGFLGAGKTTFIKELIEKVFAGEKLVLIENEFGEIGIDGGFLQDAGIEITEMNSGCICCTLVGDFSVALKKVLDEYHPDHVIIEPSGVGKLSDVAAAIEKMTEFYKGNLHDVAHFMKVWGFARTIGQLEGLDQQTQQTLEYTAVVHDIACPLCREKYGSASGKHQELVDYLRKQSALSRTNPDYHMYLARSYEALGKKSMAFAATGDMYALLDNPRAAVYQFELAQKANDGDFYIMSEIDAKLRELRQKVLDQKKD